MILNKDPDKAGYQSQLIVAGAIDGLSELNRILCFEMAARQIICTRERNERNLLTLPERQNGVLQCRMEAPKAITAEHKPPGVPR